MVVIVTVLCCCYGDRRKLLLWPQCDVADLAFSDIGNIVIDTSELVGAIFVLVLCVCVWGMCTLYVYQIIRE